MDDPQNPAQNPPSEPATTPPAPPAAPNDQPPASDPGQPPQQPPADSGDAQGTPNGQPPQQQPMTRGERRIRQLSDQLKQARQPDQFPAAQQSPQFPQYQPGQEISPEQLQQDVVQTASAIASLQVQQQLQQRDAMSNFERDSDSVPLKFDELNPNKAESYSPELDEAIAQEYQARAFRVIGYNQQTGQPIMQLDPSVRLNDIAQRVVGAARAYATRTSAGVNTRAAAAADTTSMRPGGKPPAERQFADLSIKEMEQRLGFGPR